jgi:hypothetical protein
MHKVVDVGQQPQNGWRRLLCGEWQLHMLVLLLGHTGGKEAAGVG